MRHNSTICCEYHKVGVQGNANRRGDIEAKAPAWQDDYIQAYLRATGQRAAFSHRGGGWFLLGADGAGKGVKVRMPDVLALTAALKQQADS